MLNRTRARAVDLGFAAGWGAVRSAPVGLTRRGFGAIADVASVRNGAGVRQLRTNLRRVIGPEASERELDELVAQSLRSYARYWLETFRLPNMDKRMIADYVAAHTTGVEHFVDGLARGKGVIMALPHQGNWDAVGVWMVECYGPFATVAERLQPESLFDRFVEYREGLGFEVVPLTGGARAPFDVLRERLRENTLVALVADRDLSRNGIEVQFFGEAARLPGGPAMLAATTGAALLAVTPYFTADGWGLTINAPIPVPDGRLRHQVQVMTQAMADRFAAGIAAHPADWHMLQKLWLADLPPRDSKASQPKATGGG